MSTLSGVKLNQNVLMCLSLSLYLSSFISRIAQHTTRLQHHISLSPWIVHRKMSLVLLLSVALCITIQPEMLWLVYLSLSFSLSLVNSRVELLNYLMSKLHTVSPKIQQLIETLNFTGGNKITNQNFRHFLGLLFFWQLQDLALPWRR